MIRLNTRFKGRIHRHQGKLAFEDTAEERSGGDEAVNLVRAFKDALDTGVAIGFLNRIFLHEAIAAEDLHALVYHKGQHFAAMYFGDRRLNRVLLNRSERSLGIVTGTATCLLDIGGGAEDLAL